jgi:hypothetical protein
VGSISGSSKESRSLERNKNIADFRLPIANFETLMESGG